MIDLAVNIITYNGASSFIDEAIKSVKPFIKEILVIDNGSSDGTYGFVKALFPDVMVDKMGSYNPYGKAEVLNVLKNATESDWILRVDDDEIFPKETMEEIMNIDGSVPVYSIPFLHYENGQFINPKAHKKNAFYVARLFKNIPKISWMRKAEVLAYNGHYVSSRGNQVGLCKRLNNPFLHFGTLRTGRSKNYVFHEVGHCGIPLGKYEQYLPNKN